MVNSLPGADVWMVNFLPCFFTPHFQTECIWLQLPAIGFSYALTFEKIILNVEGLQVPAFSGLSTNKLCCPVVDTSERVRLQDGRVLIRAVISTEQLDPIPFLSLFE